MPDSRLRSRPFVIGRAEVQSAVSFFTRVSRNPVLTIRRNTMASNNYAEVITDSTKAQQVLAEFEGIAARGCSFKILQFDPERDRFEIYGWRESNIPTLLDVEAGGTTMDGADVAALWSSNAETLEALNFGNGYFGLYYESESRSYVAIPEC
jgi:hypothetical protein